MGVCLCKDKVEEGYNGANPDVYTADFSGRPCRELSETVDGLVKETLEIIGSIVDK